MAAMTEPTASPADTTRAGPAQSRRGGLARWAFGIFLLAAVIGAVLHFGDIEEFATLARSAKPEWMLLALLAQAGTYVAAGAIWRAALKRAGHPQPLASLAALGLVKLFADQALPIGGVSGVIVLMRGLARRDIPPRITMAALLVDMVTYYGAYLAVVLVAVAILIVNREANAIILVGAAVFAIMVVAVPGAVLWLRRLGRFLCPPGAAASRAPCRSSSRWSMRRRICSATLV